MALAPSALSLHLHTLSYLVSEGWRSSIFLTMVFALATREALSRRRIFPFLPKALDRNQNMNQPFFPSSFFFFLSMVNFFFGPFRLDARDQFRCAELFPLGVSLLYLPKISIQLSPYRHLRVTVLTSPLYHRYSRRGPSPCWCAP